jgi:hypothetical protein
LRPAGSAPVNTIHSQVIEYGIRSDAYSFGNPRCGHTGNIEANHIRYHRICWGLATKTYTVMLESFSDSASVRTKANGKLIGGFARFVTFDEISQLVVVEPYSTFRTS